MLKELKEKFKNELIAIDNEDILTENVATMFEYPKFDNYLSYYDVPYIELYLLALGKCAIVNDTELNKYWVGTVANGGGLDEYGQSQNIYVTSRNGRQLFFENWKENENVVVIYNNIVKSRDLLIERTSEQLTEVEISLKCNLINSRYSPIASCKNAKTRNVLQKIFDSISLGKPHAIVDSDLLSVSKSIDVINVTDVTNSDKIQYLAHYKDDLTRWFYSNYGMSTYGSGKMAQQTTDEINNQSNASMIIPYDRLYWRKKAVEDLKNKFGWDVDIIFSECWRKELERDKQILNDECEHIESNEDVSSETSTEQEQDGEQDDV